GPLSLALRQGDQQAVSQALAEIENRDAPAGERLSYIKIFGEVSRPEAVPVLLRLLVDESSSPALLQAVLRALPAYDQPEIGERMVPIYSRYLPPDPVV